LAHLQSKTQTEGLSSALALAEQQVQAAERRLRDGSAALEALRLELKAARADASAAADGLVGARAVLEKAAGAESAVGDVLGVMEAGLDALSSCLGQVTLTISLDSCIAVRGRCCGVLVHGEGRGQADRRAEQSWCCQVGDATGMLGVEGRQTVALLCVVKEQLRISEAAKTQLASDRDAARIAASRSYAAAASCTQLLTQSEKEARLLIEGIAAAGKTLCELELAIEQVRDSFSSHKPLSPCHDGNDSIAFFRI
jgi:hypothetical protein